jgi:hypothetical protein
MGLPSKSRGSVVRWTLLGLYALVVISLTLGGILATSEVSGHWIIVLYFAILVGTQAVLLLGAGTSDFFRPIRRRRLLVPVSVGALMLAALVWALACGFDEYFGVRSQSWHIICWPLSLIGLSWLFWGVVLFLYTRKVDRFRAIRRIVGAVLAGSLVELLVAAPIHIVVSRRPGCFVGLQTAAAVFAGLYVMLWAMGPGIMLLFLREKRRLEEERARRRESLPGAGTQRTPPGGP